MAEFEDLGRYIQSRLRAKGVSDESVAKALNISPKTVQKIYPLKDIYSGRLSIFCKLLNENVFSDFYGRDDDLRLILDNEVVLLRSIVKSNEELLELQRKHITLLEEKLNAQNNK